MQVRSLELFRVQVPLKERFVTSHSTLGEVERILLRITCHGSSGVGQVTSWGEVGVYGYPSYIYETPEVAEIALCNYLAPLVFYSPFESALEVSERLARVVGYPASKAGLEAALLGCFALDQGKSLVELFGDLLGELGPDPSYFNPDDSGVSTASLQSLVARPTLGVDRDLERFNDRVLRCISEGYTHLKLKILAETDPAMLAEVVRGYPTVTFVGDCNGAFRLSNPADLARLVELDKVGLAFLEQPLVGQDLRGSAELRRKVSTPICLDEAIDSLETLTSAIELGALDAVSIKIPRIGSITGALRCAVAARSKGLGAWCGGVHDLGVGKLTNIALAACGAFDLPGDLTPSDFFYDRDVLVEPIRVCDGTVGVSDTPGLGGQIDEAQLERFTKSYKILRG